MPSLVSRLVPADGKGAAVGVFSSSQFFGAFIGGAGAGAIQGAFGVQAVFMFTALLLLIWFVVSFGMGSIKLKTAASEQNETKSYS